LSLVIELPTHRPVRFEDWLVEGGDRLDP